MSAGAYGSLGKSSGKGGAKAPPGASKGGKPGLRTTPFQKPIVNRKIGR